LLKLSQDLCYIGAVRFQLLALSQKELRADDAWRAATVMLRARPRKESLIIVEHVP
jgi:hypothetical protein